MKSKRLLLLAIAVVAAGAALAAGLGSSSSNAAPRATARVAVVTGRIKRDILPATLLPIGQPVRKYVSHAIQCDFLGKFEIQSVRKRVMEAQKLFCTGRGVTGLR